MKKSTKFFGWGLALSAFCTGHALASDFDAPPDWLQKPHLGALLTVYPPQAKGADGAALIKCFVTTTGVASDCKVISEEPAGLGFGAAAANLGPFMLFKPALKKGQPIESDVKIPITFHSFHSVSATNSVNIVRDAFWKEVPSKTAISVAFSQKISSNKGLASISIQCVTGNDSKLHKCLYLNAYPEYSEAVYALNAVLPMFTIDQSGDSQKYANARINLQIQFLPATSPLWTQRIIRRPQWSVAATNSLAQSEFPPEATRLNVASGRVTVDCAVVGAGALSDCRSITDTPVNMGFGSAAERAVQSLTINPWMDGLPTEGAHVLATIQFNKGKPPELISPSSSGDTR